MAIAPVPQRPNYFHGEFLKVDDFTAEQSYHKEMRRRHNVELHQPGIVRGLEVTPVAGTNTVNITAGVAVDPLGREIVLTADVSAFPIPPGTTVVAVNYQEATTGHVEEGIFSGDKRVMESAQLTTALDANSVTLAAVTSVSSSNVALDNSTRQYVEPTVPADLTVGRDLTVVGKLVVQGELHVEGERIIEQTDHMLGDVELGDQDTDEVRVHGRIVTRNTSGNLEIASPVNVAGNVAVGGVLQGTGIVGTQQIADNTVTAAKLHSSVAFTDLNRVHKVPLLQQTLFRRPSLSWLSTFSAGALSVVGKSLFAMLASNEICRYSTAPRNPIEAYIRGVNGPSGFAYDGASLWVTNCYGASLNKINPATNAIVATVFLPAGSNPVALAFDGTSVWVASQGTNSLSKISPSTNAIIGTVALPQGSTPSALIFDNTSLWVANQDSNSVSRINPTTNVIVATVGGLNGPRALAFDGTSIWVANLNMGTLSKIDRTTNTVAATVTGFSGPCALAWDNTSIWVANQWWAVVHKLNPSTNAITATVTLPGGSSNTTGIIFDGAATGAGIWVANQGSNTLCRIDIATNAVNATLTLIQPFALGRDGSSIWVGSKDLPGYGGNVSANVLSKVSLGGSPALVATIGGLGNARAATFDGTFLWVANNGGSNVIKIDPASNAIVATVMLPVTPATSTTPAGSSSPIALAFDGKSIWVANQGANSLTKIHPTTNAILATVSPLAGPSGLAWDNTSIWVTNQTAGTVVKIDPNTNAVTFTMSGFNSPSAIVFDGASLWVANAGSNTVSRISGGATNTLMATVSGFSSPAALAYDGAFVWVANASSNSISKIDPTSNTIVSTTWEVVRGGWSQGPTLTFGGGSLWASAPRPQNYYYSPWSGNGGSVTKIDAKGVIAAELGDDVVSALGFDGNSMWWTYSQHNVLFRGSVFGDGGGANFVAVSNVSAIASDGASIWLANQGSNSLTRMDGLGNVIGTLQLAAGSAPAALAFDGTSLWVANPGTNSVSKINLSTNAVVANVSVAPAVPRDLAFDGVSLWVANPSANTLSKINPSTNGVVTAVTSGLANPTALAFDGRALWVANSAANNVVKIDPATNSIIDTVAGLSEPSCAAFDGTALWVGNAATNTLSKIDVSADVILATIPLRGVPSRIAFDGMFVWVGMMNGQVARLIKIA